MHFYFDSVWLSFVTRFTQSLRSLTGFTVKLLKCRTCSHPSSAKHLCCSTSSSALFRHSQGADENNFMLLFELDWTPLCSVATISFLQWCLWIYREVGWRPVAEIDYHALKCFELFTATDSPTWVRRSSTCILTNDRWCHLISQFDHRWRHQYEQWIIDLLEWCCSTRQVYSVESRNSAKLCGW